jgi:hypothetical protein
MFFDAREIHPSGREIERGRECFLGNRRAKMESKGRGETREKTLKAQTLLEELASTYCITAWTFQRSHC